MANSSVVGADFVAGAGVSKAAGSKPAGNILIKPFLSPQVEQRAHGSLAAQSRCSIGARRMTAAHGHGSTAFLNTSTQQRSAAHPTSALQAPGSPLQHWVSPQSSFAQQPQQFTPHSSPHGMAADAGAPAAAFGSEPGSLLATTSLRTSSRSSASGATSYTHGATAIPSHTPLHGSTPFTATDPVRPLFRMPATQGMGSSHNGAGGAPSSVHGSTPPMGQQMERGAAASAMQEAAAATSISPSEPDIIDLIGDWLESLY